MGEGDRSENKTHSDNQYGFQKGKINHQALELCLRMPQVKYREFMELRMVFLDLEKAYNTIPRDLIWHCIRLRKVPEIYIDIIKDMYCTRTA